MDFEQLGQFAKARREAEFVLKQNKKNLWANEFLLNIFEQHRDWDKATQVSKNIQRIKQSKDPNQIARFLVYQGMDKLEKGQHDEAIIIFQKANTEERAFLKETFKKKERNEDDFSEVLALINKYKAVQDSFKKAEYFVNIAQGALEA